MNTSLTDDAIALAGALAEAGIQTIELRTASVSGSTWKPLTARVTDLPGLIAQADDVTELRWPGGGARVESGSLRWWGVAGLPSREGP